MSTRIKPEVNESMFKWVKMERQQGKISLIGEESGEEQKVRELPYLQSECSYNIATTLPECLEETHLIGEESKCGQIMSLLLKSPSLTLSTQVFHTVFS